MALNDTLPTELQHSGAFKVVTKLHESQLYDQISH